MWLLGRDTGRRGLETVEKLTGPTVVIQLPGLDHGNFNALEGFLPGLFESATVFPWSSGGQSAVEGYAALVRITIEAASILAGPRPSLADFKACAMAAAGDVSMRIAHDGSTW